MKNTLSLSRIFSLAFVCINSHIHAQELTVYTEILPPFQIVKGEQVEGTASDNVKQILSAGQLDFHIQAVPWARAYNTVKDTPNTFLYSINRTPEREKYFHWIAVVAEIGNSFIGLSNKDLTINSVNDAKNYVTGVVRAGYSQSTLLEQGFIENENLYVVADLAQQISLLLKGKIDVLFTDIQSVKYSLSQQGLDPNLVKIIYSQKDWTRDLYLVANIDTEPHILEKLKGQSVKPK